MNDSKQRNEFQSGLIVFLMMAIVVGGIIFGAGYFLWSRAAQAEMLAVQAEMVARDQAEQSRQLAEKLQSQANQTTAGSGVESLEIHLKPVGKLVFDGDEIAMEQLHEKLASRSKLDSSLHIHIRADDECTVGQLKRLRSICGKYAKTTCLFDPMESAVE